MRHPIPTLTIIALIGVVPIAHGANLADDLTIKPKAVIQVRGQFGADATNTAEQDWNLYNGAVGETEAARFSIRRARFGAEAKNTTGWKGVIQFRGGERADAGTGAGTRTVELYYANIAKAWKTEELEHELRFGLDKPFNNESSISSSAFLFPSDRPIAHAIETRNVGVGYQLNAMQMVRVGVDLQNGSGAGKNSADEATGLFTSARVELAPGKEYMPTKKQESYCGAEGTHVLLGFDWQNNADALNATPATSKATTTTMGPDLLVHWNGLTLLAEYRLRKTETEAIPTGASSDKKAMLWGCQAGYAFLMDAGFAMEPAVRFGKVDVDKDKDDEGPNPFDQGEYRAGQSGTEWGIGLNFYWNGMANKTQVSFNSWKGEEDAAGKNADARIFTVQHQVSF